MSLIYESDEPHYCQAHHLIVCLITCTSQKMAGLGGTGPPNSATLPPPPSTHTRFTPQSSTRTRTASRGASLVLVVPTISWLLLAARTASDAGVDALVTGRVNGGVGAVRMLNFRGAAERRVAGAAKCRGGVELCLRGGEGGQGGDGNEEDDASWQRLLAEGQAVYRELKREQVRAS